MLEAHRLTKRYFGITAVHDVSFSVRAGEVLGYLGPNGSGKTTTVRIVTAQTEPDTGQVLFHGRPIDEAPREFRERLGYVPEEPYLYPFLTGRGYLELVGGLRGLPAALLEHKINALTEIFGLGVATDQDIASYSKGMKQKILISAALLHDPDLVVLDEPEAGLDVTMALVLRHLIRILAARGKAVLYSSHVLEVVEQVCSSVLVLHRGRIVANDSVAGLRHLMSRNSLNDVFRELVLSADPETTARDIADVSGLRP
jgi:ABC-2 type transport system ATP-binding protein